MRKRIDDREVYAVTAENGLSSAKRAPKVSIGMPVYNGEPFIREALNSLLSQTFSDFELIISDNTSTDNTEKICREFELKDARVRYLRQKENIGAPANFKFVLDEAVGDYFMWAAADDLQEPEFIELLVSALDNNPSLVCVMSDVKNIGPSVKDNETLSTLDDIRIESVEHDWPEVRRRFFRNPTSEIFFCIYGLFRTDAIRDVEISYKNLIKYAFSSEIPFLAQVAVRGQIASIPNLLKIYRRHELSIYHKERKFLKFKDHILGHFTVSMSLFLIALRADLSVYQKLILTGTVLITSLRWITRAMLSKIFHLPLFSIIIKSSKIKIKNFARNLGIEISRYRSSGSDEAQLVTALKVAEIDVVFDIGANEGQFARALREHGYTGQIVSFEPLSLARKKLAYFASTDAAWRLHQQSAIGDKDGEIDINVSGNSVSSSVLPMLSSHSDAAIDSAYVGSERVSLSKLDSVSSVYLTPESNLFIKIDTQGFEWEVLEGAHETLKKARGVHCELSLVPLYEGQKLWRDIVDRLDTEGFMLWALQKGFTNSQTGQSLQMNGVFLREGIDDVTAPRRHRCAKVGL